MYWGNLLIKQSNFAGSMRPCHSIVRAHWWGLFCPLSEKNTFQMFLILYIDCKSIYKKLRGPCDAKSLKVRGKTLRIFIALILSETPIASKWGSGQSLNKYPSYSHTLLPRIDTHVLIVRTIKILQFFIVKKRRI